LSASNTAYEFNPDIPKACGPTCPPSEAQPVNQKIYRGIRTPPVKPDDFLSHVELQLDSDASNCEHWGLSVWVTRDAVDHAIKTFRPLRKWHIAEGVVNATDGVLLATPTGRQPQHHTFWKVFGKDLTGNFTIILAPANAP
jgi:hypothetical protein